MSHKEALVQIISFPSIHNLYCNSDGILRIFCMHCLNDSKKNFCAFSLASNSAIWLWSVAILWNSALLSKPHMNMWDNHLYISPKYETSLLHKHIHHLLKEFLVQFFASFTLLILYVKVRITFILPHQMPVRV